MKQYIKNGKIKYKNEIIVCKNKKQIINPKEETILEDGWVEYLIPEPSDELKEIAEKINKKRDIEYHMDSLKGLIINDKDVKIDTETLNKLTFRIMAESLMKKSKTNIWFNGELYNMKTKDALELCYNLLIYFGELFDISESHKNNIESLSGEDVKNYDITAGYPEKLVFSV